MKSLFLTVALLGLVAVLQAQDDLPFLSEEKKLSGIWFLKATVQQRQAEGTLVVAFPHRVACPEEGTLEIRATTLSDGQCIKVAIRMQRTEGPGQYSAFWGHNLFYIYELPVKDHYIIYGERNPFEKRSQSAGLLGKCQEENLEALEEFKKFIQHKGLLQENIIVPVQKSLSLISVVHAGCINGGECAKIDEFSGPLLCTEDRKTRKEVAMDVSSCNEQIASLVKEQAYLCILRQRDPRFPPSSVKYQHSQLRTLAGILAGKVPGPLRSSKRSLLDA
ncbi:vomeronasal secretory protein 2-like [Acomys russatus]|uniref:vomeronasal secretory protein 2-like n=1 Tax=Acomys russatus TaxID=60746 RepID=UPI0021E2180C|nr:vomeronasal secretory protein 2-like [Acomys russatus]